METKSPYIRTDTLIGNADVSYDFKINKPDESTSQPNDVILFTFNEEKQQIEVVFKKKAELLYKDSTNSEIIPDRVWKEIYGVVEGKLALIETIDGKHTPGYYTPETIVFEEPESTENL